jgi:hypothetical protein
MVNYVERLFIIIVSNAGGQGKTTLARLLKALLEMGGHPVQILDGDAGNAAISTIDPTAARLGWGVQSTVNADIVEAFRDRNVILDLGANTMASAREIVDMLPELIAAFEAAGHRTLAVFPVTPNKAGAAGALERLTQLFPAQNKLVVLNDADGSGNFEPLDSPLPIARLAQLAPGFMGYLDTLPGRSFNQAVISPAADRQIAGQHIARWMRSFGKDLPFEAVFGSAIKMLGRIPEPDKIRFKIDKVASTTDEQLIEAARRTTIIDLLDQHDWDLVRFRAAIDNHIGDQA